MLTSTYMVIHTDMYRAYIRLANALMGTKCFDWTIKLNYDKPIR